MKVLIALLISFGGAVVSYACEQEAAATSPQISHKAMRAAMEACATENKLSRPEPGQRPSDEDRAKMESCLKSKGIDHMPRPPHHKRPTPEEAE